MTATLNDIPPKGYYLRGKQYAESKHQALKITVQQCQLTEPDFKLPPGTQTTFLERG